MLGAGVLLLLLDGAILSPGPDATRATFAAVVTLAVLAFIGATWRANTRLEKREAERQQPG